MLQVIRNEIQADTVQHIILVLVVDHNWMKCALFLVPMILLHFVLDNEMIVFCKVQEYDAGFFIDLFFLLFQVLCLNFSSEQVIYQIFNLVHE